MLNTAQNKYYEIDRVREFWDWLIYMGTKDSIKIPLEMHEEIKDGNDELANSIVSGHTTG